MNDLNENHVRIIAAHAARLAEVLLGRSPRHHLDRADIENIERKAVVNFKEVSATESLEAFPRMDPDTIRLLFTIARTASKGASNLCLIDMGHDKLDVRIHDADEHSDGLFGQHYQQSAMVLFVEDQEHGSIGISLTKDREGLVYEEDNLEDRMSSTLVMTPESSSVDSFAWDDKDGHLYVTFKPAKGAIKGTMYRYAGATREVYELMAEIAKGGGSIGSYVSRNVARNYAHTLIN